MVIEAGPKIFLKIIREFFSSAFEVLKQPSLDTHQSSFHRKTSGVDTSQLIISTFRSPKVAGVALQ
jgi:hypothetical protein